MMPIFMIGTQRSGSNLLRLMLNQLPEIAAPHPPHILQRFMPLVPSYGDLRVDANFFQLVEDVCRLVELNPVPWDGVELNRAGIVRGCRERSLVSVQAAVYDVYAGIHHATTWCCKSLANINYVPEIEAYFKKPRYIYLFRDGRDVAVSFRKAVVGEKHFYHIAKEWVATQKLALALGLEIDRDRFMRVRYEDLIHNPEGTARDICDFLGVPFRGSMLNYYSTEEAKRASSSSDLWNNVVSPVMRDNSGKFLREASERDIRIFESVAGPVLDALRYDRHFVKQGKEQVYAEYDIKTFDAENSRIKEEICKHIDPADQNRRDQQTSLLHMIRNRQVSLTLTT